MFSWRYDLKVALHCLVELDRCRKDFFSLVISIFFAVCFLVLFFFSFFFSYNDFNFLGMYIFRVYPFDDPRVTMMQKTTSVSKLLSDYLVISVIGSHLA